MTVKIDGVPITKLAEVSINRILTAKNEVGYIVRRAKKQGNITPQLEAAISEEFKDLEQSAARLLSYLTILNSK